MNEKKSNSGLIVLVIILIICVLGLGGYLIYNLTSNKNEVNNNQTITTITTTTTTTSTTSRVNENVDQKEDLSAISLFEVAVDNNIIKFPATKESFANTGWVWDEKYANKTIDTGYTTTGGRIGKYPGGVVVTVINNSGEQKKIQDCIIDDATFYNPGDGSENVTFIGGLNYNSSEEDVKKVMSNLGYQNVKEKINETQSYYDYYMNDDQNNFKNYIEFYFYNGVIKSVSIFTSGN